MAVSDFNYTAPEDAPDSFGAFADWIKQMMADGQFSADFESWDPSQFNQQADETYGGTMDVANRFMDMSQGRNEMADIEAGRARQINADYMGRTGVSGSAALNQMNRVEGELLAQQQQWQSTALQNALGAYGQGFGITSGQAGVQQTGTNLNNTWEQQGVDDAFGMADIMSMFPAFDIAWQGTEGGPSEEDLQRMFEEWMNQRQQQQGAGSNPNTYGGEGGQNA